MYTIYIYQFDNLQPPPPRLLSAFTWYNPSKRANQKLNIMSNWQRSAHYAYTSVYVCVCVERGTCTEARLVPTGSFSQTNLHTLCIHILLCKQDLSQKRQRKEKRKGGGNRGKKKNYIHPPPSHQTIFYLYRQSATQARDWLKTNRRRIKKIIKRENFAGSRRQMSAEPETTMANEPATMLFLHIPQSAPPV